MASLRARPVDENAAHHLRGDAEKMRAVAPLYAPLIDETEICLVNERRRLQRVSLIFASHGSRGLTMELVVDRREKTIGRVGVTVAPGEEQSGDIRGSGAGIGVVDRERHDETRMS